MILLIQHVVLTTNYLKSKLFRITHSNHMKYKVRHMKHVLCAHQQPPSSFKLRSDTSCADLLRDVLHPSVNDSLCKICLC